MKQLVLIIVTVLVSSLAFAQSDSLYHFRANGNPLIKHKFTADPAALVVGDTLWLFTGQDGGPDLQKYAMRNWCVFSTTDMVNWTEYPTPLKPTDFSWASNNAWASHVEQRNGKFYFYVSTHQSGIGVAIADRPEGPYKDALGKPLITREDCFASKHGASAIDPAIFIDDDGTPYLFWGHRNCYYVKLKDNMIELDGEIKQITFDGLVFTEGPWVHKRGDYYYLSYATEFPEKTAYAMSKSIHGPWEYKGILNELAGNCITNHQAIVEFKGEWYFIYHNGGLKGGADASRSVCIDRLYYNPDGTMKRVIMTTEGVNMMPLTHRVSSEKQFPYNMDETIAWSNPFQRVVLTADNPHININNQLRDANTLFLAPFMRNGILYVPFEAAQKATGNEVKWKQNNPPWGANVTATYDSKTFSANVERRQDVLFVPLKTFTDALNFNTVGWDKESGTLIVTTGIEVDLGQMTQRRGQQQPAQWFGSPEAIRIADNILLHQRGSGGWHKNEDFGHLMTEEKKNQLLNEKSFINATVDNGATIPEIIFLIKAYEATGIKRFEDGYLLGMNAVLNAQYANGGFPQYLKDHRWYRGQITFNDNAMASVVEFFTDVAKNSQNYPTLTGEMIERCRIAAKKGLQCILDLQIYNEKLDMWAAWAQQYDQHTGKPAMARAYEPASVGAWESLRLIAYLMSIENPSMEIQTAIHRAVAWYDYAVAEGWELQVINRNRTAVQVPGARNTWGRFHCLETYKPMFIIVTPPDEENIILYGMDKYNDLPQEGRNRYQFIGQWARNLKDDYANWKQRNGIQ